MWIGIMLFVLYFIECLPALPRNLRYRNINALAAAFWILVTAIITDAYLALTANLSYGNQELFRFMALQTGILVAVKLMAARKDSLVKYGIPMRYTNGWRYKIISIFYATEKRSAVMYTREVTNQIGIVVFLCVSAVFGTIVYQANGYSTVGNTLIMPFSTGALFSFLVEFSIFCLGESRWEKLLKQYKNRKSCRNRRELAEARFASFTDFSYIFMKNFVWEYLYILRANKFNWKPNSDEPSINYYEFDSGLKELYAGKEFNPQLEEFIKANDLQVNSLYVAAYNLIERNQNVLLKTPSYVDFEPYLTAIIKMKVAKTKKIVLVVSNEEKKKLTLEKINNSFKEYMGFDEIPLMMIIDECVKNLLEAKKIKTEENAQLSHFDELTRKGNVEFEEMSIKPTKSADIVIAAPEDILCTENTEFLRSAIKDLGLIIYYDFADAVQEEALFSKIVHSVLDYDDRISTLYMADSFFDLEQVVDNFFSKRNIYQIVVPRKTSKQSYVMSWKAESISEIQSRTYPDASRDIGNHIPILYDAGGHTENDLMIVEDELDVYVENRTNFSNEELSKRFDYHVGWTDVIGGNSVMCTVSDTYNNVAHTYLSMTGVGRESEYINIISRPYLLRNYLSYHLRYFALNPGVLASCSPGLIKTPQALSYEAIAKLYIAGCTEEQLLKYVQMTCVKCEKSPEEMIKALVQCAGYDKDDSVEITKNLHERYFIDYQTYSYIIDKSRLLEKIEFVTNRHVYVRNKRNYSYLIPRQKIVLDGIKYTVEKIQGNRVELTDSNTREPISVMRPIRSFKAKVNSVEEYGSYIQDNNNSSLTFRRLISDIELVTHGNIVFKGSYHPFRTEARFDYQMIDDAEAKTYAGINIFNISLGSRLINSENRDRLAILLASLFNEMLPTFFPRHSKRVIVACNGWTPDAELDVENISIKNIVAQMEIENFDVDKENEINLYFAEDSPIETGLVNVFWQDEEFRHMLKVLEDYLYYQRTINRKEQKEIFAEDYIKDLNLLRRILLEVINETVEIEEDDKSISVVYQNFMRNIRNKFNNLDITHNFDITCDFCGKKISGKGNNSIEYKFYAYSGLVSCMDCYHQAVCSEKYSQENIRKLAGYVNEWFFKRYGDCVGNQFYNYLEDSERILDMSGVKERIVVTDDYDTGVVAGLAASGKYVDDVSVIPIGEIFAITEDTEYPAVGYDEYVRASHLVEDTGRAYILIKNGMSYSTYMGVLTHEMTHQWQFANLDFSLLEINPPNNYVNEFEQVVDMTDFRSEGHAEWEKIQYMKKHGQRWKAYREARILNATRNAYGYGYVWMSKMMRVGGDDKDIPVKRTFSFIMKRNWYQFRKNSFALMRLYFGNGETTTKNTTKGTVPTPSTEVPAEPKPVNKSDKGVSYVPQTKDRVTYEEVAYYYRNAITESEKALYDRLLAGILQFEEKATVAVTDANMETIERIIGCIRGDHPEIFWFNTFALLNCDVIFSYNATKEEAEEIRTRMEPVIAKYLDEVDDSMSAYDVALHFHMKIINSADYDTATLEKGEQEGIDYIRTICGVFLNNKAVCAGYARSMQYLLQKCGIECAYVRGNTLGSETREGGPHGWNLVKIDGDYYFIDTTWDDSSDTTQTVKETHMSFNYFCITTEEILRSRKLDLNVLELPVFTAKKANYYYHNDLIIDSYDVEKLKIMAQNAAKAGRTILTFKCSSQEVYDVAHNKLYANSDDCYVLLAEAHKADSTVKEASCTRYCNDRIRTITLLFEGVFPRFCVNSKMII